MPCTCTFTLFTVLFTVQKSLFTVHKSLFTVQKSLFTVQKSFFTVQKILFTVQKIFCLQYRKFLFTVQKIFVYNTEKLFTGRYCEPFCAASDGDLDRDLEVRLVGHIYSSFSLVSLVGSHGTLEASLSIRMH